MKILLIALFAMTLAAMAAPHAEDLDAWTYEVFAAEFRPGLLQGTQDWSKRVALFNERLAEAKTHNADKTATWKMGINKFSDWTDEERKALLRYIPAANKRGPRLSPPAPRTDLPDSVDWRAKGKVTPVKDQASCGSCWAFAAIEAIEASAAINSNKDPEVLSVEQLVQCTPNPNHCGGTGGCSGATAELAYQYAGNQTGITTQKLLPYTASTGTCHWSAAKYPPVVKVSGYTQVKENDRNGTLTLLATMGPASIGVFADPWFSYSSGIFSGCNRHPDMSLDHGVQVVAYSTAADGSIVWTVRNSWGPGWGERGYIRLADTSACVPDKHPENGSGCKGGPSEVTVCGPCGLFYEVAFPRASFI